MRKGQSEEDEQRGKRRKTEKKEKEIKIGLIIKLSRFPNKRFSQFILWTAKIVEPFIF